MARLKKLKSGRVLTKELLDELVKEAEEGYDHSELKPVLVRPGRPSLEKGGNGASPRISYRLERGLYAKAKKKAEAEGRTVSQLAREALRRYVERSR